MSQRKAGALMESSHAIAPARTITKLLNEKYHITVNMKLLALFVATIFLLQAAGCSLAFRRSTYNDGFDFPAVNISKIIKGKTTGDQIIQMFGGPLSKRGISENEEEWRYSYSTGIEIIEKAPLSDSETSTGYRKTLVVRLKNGTVTDFNYIESSQPVVFAPAM